MLKTIFKILVTFLKRHLKECKSQQKNLMVLEQNKFLKWSLMTTNIYLFKIYWKAYNNEYSREVIYLEVILDHKLNYNEQVTRQNYP